jgi:hypothetical protein
MNHSTSPQPMPRDLGDGLILRRSRAADAEALAEFCARVHSDDGWDKPDAHIAAWTRDLLARPHPTFQPDDFTIVEEAASGRIVSSLNLISQTWTYEGIPFGVGRPELVGTLPEFRKRGLVRLQFEQIHRWSVERGEQVQAITGIPYYYRQFGYEMALDLAGIRFGYQAQVRKLKDGETEPYRVRPAVRADLPFVAQLYEETQARYAISCQRTPAIWDYDLDGRSADNLHNYRIHIIEDASGRPVGFLQHPDRLFGGSMVAYSYELARGHSWLAVTPGIVRYLWETGKACAATEDVECHSFGFMLGASHPAYEALGRDLPRVAPPYAFYLRLPDLPGFLAHIKPALEKRLANSIAAGHDRTLKISFYRSGLKLVIEKGRLAGVEPWTSIPREDEADTAFPGLTFLQLLFGYRSFDELETAFADCYREDEDARILLNILFPKKLSAVFPVA